MLDIIYYGIEFGIAWVILSNVYAYVLYKTNAFFIGYMSDLIPMLTQCLIIVLPIPILYKIIIVPIIFIIGKVIRIKLDLF
jgi:hypothetical protein